jgi:hypothetical protein
MEEGKEPEVRGRRCITKTPTFGGWQGTADWCAGMKMPGFRKTPEERKLVWGTPRVHCVGWKRTVLTC